MSPAAHRAASLSPTTLTIIRKYWLRQEMAEKHVLHSSVPTDHPVFSTNTIVLAYIVVAFPAGIQTNKQTNKQTNEQTNKQV